MLVFTDKWFGAASERTGTVDTGMFANFKVPKGRFAPWSGVANCPW